MNILQNENLIIESSSFGAELTKIFSKNTTKTFFGMVIKNIGVDNRLYCSL